jgi:hypothetical protein
MPSDAAFYGLKVSEPVTPQPSVACCCETTTSGKASDSSLATTSMTDTYAMLEGSQSLAAHAQACEATCSSNSHAHVAAACSATNEASCRDPPGTDAAQHATEYPLQDAPAPKAPASPFAAAAATPLQSKPNHNAPSDHAHGSPSAHSSTHNAPAAHGHVPRAASGAYRTQSGNGIAIVLNPAWVQLLSPIGEGAFSRVYEATFDPPDGLGKRVVAVKILKRTHLKKKNDCLRFIKEAKIMTKVNHRCAKTDCFGPQQQQCQELLIAVDCCHLMPQ